MNKATVWAANAKTDVSEPVQGEFYRDTNITPAEIAAGARLGDNFSSPKMNQLFNQLSDISANVAVYGGLPWAADLVYPVGARAMSTSGATYQCLVENGPGTAAGPQSPPATETGATTYWASLEPPATRSLASPTALSDPCPDNMSIYGWQPHIIIPSDQNGPCGMLYKTVDGTFVRQFDVVAECADQVLREGANNFAFGVRFSVPIEGLLRVTPVGAAYRITSGTLTAATDIDAPMSHINSIDDLGLRGAVGVNVKSLGGIYSLTVLVRLNVTNYIG